MGGSLVAFLGLAIVVIATPGQDTALIIRNTLAGGRSSGFATSFGITCGLLMWTTVAAVGLTAMLIASEPVFVALKLVGGTYLIYVGATSLLAAARGTGSHDTEHPQTAPRLTTTPWRSARQGAISNLSNPKIAILFTSLMPPFLPSALPPFAGFLLLGAIFSSLTLVWLCGYAVVVERAGDRLRSGPMRRALDAIAGAILIALGIRIATEPA
jgi:threonine/homoserine/homoserine lactone efflux protein